jgi:SAM-dependent methyltransferase
MNKQFSQVSHQGTTPSSIDSPETTADRRQVIRNKPFLYNIYKEWYKSLAASMPEGTEPVLEIGSGAGFLSEFIPNLVTSDILDLSFVDHVFDACQTFPFEDRSLRGIAFVNTLHHLPDCRSFFQEASRCLKPGGVLTMIEPWSTHWSSFVYSRLHHEPYDMKAEQWHFQSQGPLSSANGALPWIVFSRDRAIFESEFPDLAISQIQVLMPLRYLLSGGFSIPTLVPIWTFGLFKTMETLLDPLMSQIGMFAHIVVTKRAINDANQPTALDLSNPESAGRR